MSGSNAIAAAKRRRGGVEINKSVSGVSQNQNQKNISGNPSQIHPLQLVMINHERLNKISNEFPQALDSLGDNFNALSSNCDFLLERIDDLDKKLNSDLSNVNKSDILNQLSNRLDGVENNVIELTKKVAIAQNYMLELSLSVNDCKKSIDVMTSKMNDYKLLSASNNNVLNVDENCDISCDSL